MPSLMPPLQTLQRSTSGWIGLSADKSSAPRFSAGQPEPAAPSKLQSWATTLLAYCPPFVKSWLAQVVETVQDILQKVKSRILGPMVPGEVRSLFKTRFVEVSEMLCKVTGQPWLMATRPGIKQGAVVVIPVTSKNELVLIEQNRPPVQTLNGKETKGCIELPAGLIGDSKEHEDEAALDTAPRELKEETGYEADKLTYLGWGANTPGLSDEIAHYVKAEGLTKVTDDLGVDGESITNVHVVPLKNIDQWLVDKQNEGYVINCAVYSGLGLLRGKKTVRNTPTEPPSTSTPSD